MKKPDSGDAIQNLLNARVLGALAPTFIAISLVTIAATAMLAPSQWTRNIPPFLTLMVIAADWVMIRKGMLKLAAGVFLAVLSISAAVGMALNGGVNAPIFSSTLSLLAIVAWLYGRKGAAVFAILWGALTALTVFLQARGLIADKPRPSPPLIALYMAAYLALAYISTVIPSGMLRKALEESEARREAAEAAEKLAKAASASLAERERALLESEAQYKALVSNIPGVTYRCANDDKWTISFVSESIEELTGYPPSDFTDSHVRSYASIIHPDDGPLVAESISAALGRREAYALSYRIIHESGETRWVYERGQGVFDGSGTLLHLSGVVMDATKEREREESLRQAIKMQAVGQLAGGIAHDFNNLLGGIMGFAELSLERAAEDSRLLHYQEQILKASQRAKGLVQQILAFSRRGAELRTPRSLGPLLSEAISFLEGTIPSSVRIILDSDGDTPEVMADETQIHELVVNLATNASHAMNEKGVIAFALRAVNVESEREGRIGPIGPGAYSVLTVSDTGEGITDAVQLKMFEPFFTTKPVGKGIGMGLAVVFGIMQSGGGNITVESAPGKGTSISLYFPCVKGSSRSEAGREPETAGGRGSILFVDDERMIVEIAEESIGSLGYQVRATSDCAEALDLLGRDAIGFDLLITDQTMPAMTGTELAARAAALRPGMPVILCTGYSYALDPDGGKNPNIVKVLMKPLTRSELARAIGEALCGVSGEARRHTPK
jgi:PAS domain S-box-containing protein